MKKFSSSVLLSLLTDLNVIRRRRAHVVYRRCTDLTTKIDVGVG
jgi:hypothetical protein